MIYTNTVLCTILLWYVPYEQMREKMLASLKGKGAFRRFKDTVFYLGIRDDWFAYRDNRFRDIAERWCMDNKLL